MDNIIQVLVIIFVIWSIIGSAFKKKPQSTNQAPRRNSGEGLNEPSPKYSKTSQDVLEEILGFKIPKTENNYRNEPEYETVDLEKEVQDLETDLTDSETTGTKFRSILDVNYDKQSSLETSPDQLILSELNKEYTKAKFVSPRTTLIRERIKTPASLRDVILISEILNKPKALRK